MVRKTVQEIRTAGQADQEVAVERLVAAYLRSGDRQTLGAILDACSGRVWSFALRHTSTRFDAEDLAQEVLLAVSGDLDRLRDPEAFWPWLHSVERHVSSRWYTRRRREQGLFFQGDRGWGTASASEGPVLLACLTPPCEEGLLDAELKQRLQSSIRALGRIYRDILVGFYVRGQNCSSLAAELGLPVGTVKRRLHEARSQLAQRLKSEEVEKPMRSNLGVPRRLYAYMDGSTGTGLPPWKYFERLLPQNIALTAHERALTAAEVAELLGVARPYIEEEVERLVRAELMREVRRPGNGDPAYQTNFFILDEGTCAELESRLKEAGRVVAPLLVQLVNEHGAEIRGSAASCRYLDDERLYWVFGPLALRAALAGWQPEPPPRRPDGGRWYMHGFADSHPWWLCGTNIYGPEDEGKPSELRYGTAIFWMTGQGAKPSPLSYRELQLASRILDGWLPASRSGMARDITEAPAPAPPALTPARASASRGEEEEAEEELLAGMISRGLISREPGRLAGLTVRFVMLRGEEETRRVTDVAVRLGQALHEALVPLREQVAAVLHNRLPSHLEEELPEYVWAAVHQIWSFVVAELIEQGVLTRPDRDRWAREGKGILAWIDSDVPAALR